MVVCWIWQTTILVNCCSALELSNNTWDWILNLLCFSFYLCYMELVYFNQTHWKNSQNPSSSYLYTRLVMVTTWNYQSKSKFLVSFSQMTSGGQRHDVWSTQKDLVAQKTEGVYSRPGYLIAKKSGLLENIGLRDQRESRWSLGIDIICPVSTGLGLDIHQISKSWWVSVLTSNEFSSLDESRSWHSQNIKVSVSSLRSG